MQVNIQLNNSNIHFHFYVDGVFIDTIRLGNSYLTGELDATGKDISSFKFNGRAVYNVQEVFDEIPLDAYELAYTNIEDYGYNKYRVSSNGSEVIINKGQFYYEGGLKDSTNNFYTGGELKKYPVIGLEKANVYIDVNIVINSDNQPVETDADGNFTISVPIGNHKIEIKKDGHTFEHTGYFPASDTFEFLKIKMNVDGL